MDILLILGLGVFAIAAIIMISEYIADDDDFDDLSPA